MKIVSIKYDKRTGEYEIKTRNHKTGKLEITFSNHLTDTEKTFLLCALTHDNEIFTVWTR
jgi:hypothetical protein